MGKMKEFQVEKATELAHEKYNLELHELTEEQQAEILILAEKASEDFFASQIDAELERRKYG